MSEAEKEFRKDLEIILKKHDAEISICLWSNEIEVTIYPIYKKGTLKEERPMIEFDL